MNVELETSWPMPRGRKFTVRYYFDSVTGSVIAVAKEGVRVLQEIMRGGMKAAPARRGKHRGRPPGSKDKKAAGAANAAGKYSGAAKRRGRPKKTGRTSSAGAKPKGSRRPRADPPRCPTCPDHFRL